MKKILFSTVFFLLSGCALILTAKEFPLLRQGKSVPVILENKDTEVQSPDDEIPVCAVPKAC